MSLYEKTLDLMKNRPRRMTLKTIAKETDLSMGWLVNMSGSDPPKHPSVNLVEQLYCYLTGHSALGEKNGDTERADCS